MDLPTHAFFGLALGLIFCDRPELALIVAVGTLLPDLDREYWFIPSKFYRDEQYHRALLHNVFFIAITYVIHPLLALGIFLHMLLDSFTTSKDRGCEWFFPFSRLVKRGRYDVNMEPQPLDPNERVYFYHEDLHATIEYADPFLPESPRSPWRRVYGPALNSKLLDKGFLIGSIGLIIVWALLPDGTNLQRFPNDISTYIPFAVLFFAIAILFLAGELDRRDQDAPLQIPRLTFLRRLAVVKYPLFAFGIALFIAWLALFWNEISTNLQTIVSNWLSIVCAIALIAIIATAIIKLSTINSQKEAVV